MILQTLITFFCCVLLSTLHALKKVGHQVFRPPKDIVASQAPVSEGLMHKLSRIALEVFDIWVEGDQALDFKDVPLNLMVISEASMMLFVYPIYFFEHVECCIKRIRCILLPDDKVNNPKKKSRMKGLAEEAYDEEEDITNETFSLVYGHAARKEDSAKMS